MKVITINREFGSGGREVAKRLSDLMGFSYYDEEIISRIASDSYGDSDESNLNISLRTSYSLTFSSTFSKIAAFSPSSLSVMQGHQSRVLRELPDNDCIIVGCGADVIMSEHDPFKVFVCADKDSKIARCRERQGEEEKGFTDKDYEKKMKHVDKTRIDYHDILSAYPWGRPGSYNICINTTDISIKEVVPLLAEYAKAWFERK